MWVPEPTPQIFVGSQEPTEPTPKDTLVSITLFMFYKQRCSRETGWHFSEFWWCCLYCLGYSAPLLLSFKILTPLVAYLKIRAWLTNIKVPVLPHPNQVFYYKKGTITVMGQFLEHINFAALQNLSIVSTFSKVA